MRRRSAGLVVAVMVLALVSVVSLAGHSDRVAIPVEGPWLIYVEPEAEIPGPCLDDPAVESSAMPLIWVWPPVGVTISLVDGSTREDVERIVACLLQGVPASWITVSTATESSGEPPAQPSPGWLLPNR